jgi:hypothetical protein
LEVNIDTSGYAKIYYGGSGVRVYCTDEKIIEQILEELKKYIPSYRSHVGDCQLISGEVYGVWIDKLQSKDEIVAFWILKKFTSQGWEPFETQGGFPDTSNSTVYLRFIGNHINKTS